LRIKTEKRREGPKVNSDKKKQENKGALSESRKGA